VPSLFESILGRIGLNRHQPRLMRSSLTARVQVPISPIVARGRCS
jgi:hypothetical protein